MSRFYFDFHDAGGILSDDAGEELPSVNIARNIALETVGQAIRTSRIAITKDGF